MKATPTVAASAACGPPNDDGGARLNEPNDDNADDDDRYCDDAEYRLQCGPSIERWGESGFLESLVGLQLSLPFGHGECRGRVTGTTKGEDGNEMLAVSWTCPPDTEAFESILPDKAVLGCYFRGRERPSWLSDEKYEQTLDGALFKAPANSKLVNFQLPNDAGYSFPWVDDERGGRWCLTLRRLNDPAAAHMYAPQDKSYPLPLLLAMITLTMEEEGGAIVVPDVVTAAKAEVYALADQFAYRLTGGENRAAYGHGYGQLKMLETIVRDVAEAAPAGAMADESWARAYVQVEALLLTLSGAFEDVHTDWLMADDAGRVNGVSASVILAVAAVLLQPPSATTRARITGDLAHLKKHMQAGTFSHACAEDSFAAEFPVAARAWSLLCELGQ